MADGMVCPRCGGQTFSNSRVLWPDLIRTWGLSPYEVSYINRQQGTCCVSCGSSLRVLALVKALLHEYHLTEPFDSSVLALTNLRILEINQAGNLTSTLQKLPGHVLVEYPDVDMQSMPWGDGSFDLIVHSDTLEHVPDSSQALRECERLLRRGGAMCFTAPIIIGRLSQYRQGLEPSYHGGEVANSPDLLVHSEFGADIWAIVLGAGFVSCTITALELPSAIALTAHKESRRG